MAFFCNRTYLGTDAGRISTCRNAVDTISSELSSFWQRVRRDCGQWSYGGIRGDFSSAACQSANAALRANAYYVVPEGGREPVTSQLTESVRFGLWNNPTLKE